MRLRLRDPLGVFYDPETGLRLRMKQEVEVSSIEGRLTKDWVNSGGIIIVKEGVVSSVEEEPRMSVLDPQKEGVELPVLTVPPPPASDPIPKQGKRPRRLQKRK